MSPRRPKGTAPPGHQRQEIQGVSCIGWVWCSVRWTCICFGHAGGSGWPPVQLNVSPTSTVAGVLLAGADLEWDSPWGDASHGWVHPPWMVGKEAIVWESRPLRAKPFWRSVVDVAGLGMSVPQGTQRHSRASSASKVSEECQKSLLLALGQLGTGRIFLNVKWFHPWIKFQEILAPLARVLKLVYNSLSHVTCGYIEHHYRQHSASVSLALTY